MYSAVKDFVSLFFYDECQGCRNPLIKGEAVLCTVCLSELPKTNFHLQSRNPVTDKLFGRLHITSGFAFLKFSKKGIVRNLLHNLKYRNHPEIGEKLGMVYGNELFKAGISKQFDLIVPVPLHRSRKRHRGYNQSTMFGHGLSASMQLVCDESIIERKLPSSTQTSKSKADRWENVNNVFQVNHAEKIFQKRILLVDDVVTTGATLEACGQQLINSKCLELSVACIANT